MLTQETMYVFRYSNKCSFLFLFSFLYDNKDNVSALDCVGILGKISHKPLKEFYWNSVKEIIESIFTAYKLQEQPDLKEPLQLINPN